MKGTLVTRTEFVHGQRLPDDRSKFCVTDVVNRDWDEFDEDVHCEGAFLMWLSKDAKKNIATKAKYTSKSRKRKVNKGLWKQIEAKKSRECGKSYISRWDKVVNEKIVPEGRLCSEKCRLKCSEKLDVTARTQLFDNFYSLNQQEKHRYIFSCIETFKPIQTKNIRSDSHCYFIVMKQEKIQICKSAVMNLFSISSSYFLKAQKAHQGGSCSPSPLKSGRSKGSRCKMTSEEKIDEIRKHIEKFPAEMSHSRKKNPNRKYLQCDLSISKMYAMYKREAIDPVKENIYSRVFVTDFNLGFGSPRSDTCSTCDEFKANETAIDIFNHKKDYEEGYRLMTEDREEALRTPGINFVTFDLEKCLPLPKLTTGIVYYKRQINLYNMDIHICNVPTNNGFMHIWPENLAGRGASQVGSCLLTFSEWSTIVPGVLNVWSDSCAGQNKNFMIICLWQLLILKGTFSMITHKFPIVGHSFNDSDRDGGKVENVLKTKENIYDIDGYIDCIRDAKKKNKFEVRRMNKCFVDLTHAIKQLNLIRRTKNEDGEKIELRDKV